MAKTAPKKRSNSIKLAELTALIKECTGADLIQKLEAQGVHFPLLVKDVEPLRLNRFIDWIKETALANNSDAVLSAQGSELTNSAAVEQLKRSLSTPSLFTKTQLLVIHNFQDIRASQAKSIVQLFERGFSGSFSIVAWVESGKREVVPASLADRATMLVFEPLSGPQLTRWVEREFAKVGVTIASAVAELLIERVGPSLTALNQAIQRIALSVDQNQKVEPALVVSLTTSSQDSTGFALFHDIARRDLPKALHSCRLLIDEGMHPLQINSNLSRSVRALLAHKTADRVSGELGNSWYYSKISGASSLFSTEDLSQAIRVLAATDLALKSSGTDHNQVIETTVQKIALRTKNSARL